MNEVSKQQAVLSLIGRVPDELLREQLEEAVSQFFSIQEVEKITRAILAKAELMSDHEARFLVGAYYSAQEARKRYDMQAAALEKSGEPHELMQWLLAQAQKMENQIKRGLDAFTDVHPMGSWMRSITGIGPVLSAGLLAHLSIERKIIEENDDGTTTERLEPTSTAGSFWAFAGWNGDKQKPWKAGEKRPFNADLRSLCWKVGQCFMKFSNHPNCYYGKMYKQRKAYEIARNDRGDNAERCVTILANKKFGKETEAFKWYSAGKLPPAHIDAQARRWAVKLFLSHLHGVWYEKHFNAPAPKPYAIAFLGHTDFIPPPMRHAA